MMIKHLRDLLRAYLKEHAAAQIRVQKPKLLIYDEYLKTYVSAEELLLPGEKRFTGIERPVLLSSSNEVLLIDFLLKKFINPKLDVLPLGINHDHEFLHLHGFERTNQVNFGTSSANHFWRKKKGAKDKKHTNYPALPPVHDKPQQEARGPLRQGWAGQLTKAPVSDPRPEKGSSSCSVGPEKDPKKKPKKKKSKNLVCGEGKKEEKENSAGGDTQEKKKDLELQSEDCQGPEDAKSATTSLQPQDENQQSSKLSKEQSTKDSQNLFKKFCSKLFSNRSDEDKTRRKENICMNSKSQSKPENDPCEMDKQVETCNKTTENIEKVNCKKDKKSKLVPQSVQDECNVCDSAKEAQQSVKPEPVENKFFPKMNTKPCTTSLTSSKTSRKTKSDPYGDIEDNANLGVEKGIVCSEIKNTCVAANVEKMKKECKKALAQELKPSSHQKSLKCTENKEDICSKDNSAINKYNFTVNPKIQKLTSPCSKNVVPPNAGFRECKDKSNTTDQSSKDNKPCAGSEINICKNKKCPLALSKSTNKPCPTLQQRDDSLPDRSTSCCAKSELKPVKRQKTTKDALSKKEGTICASKEPQEKVESNFKGQSKSLSAFQCQHVEPKAKEKLEIISQETALNQLDMNSDLSQLKCGRYMGFKVKRSSSEVNERKEIKNDTCKSQNEKLKSAEQIECGKQSKKSETKMKKPKKSKSNENHSKLQKSYTKVTRSERCLKSLKSSKTSLKKSKSSTEKKLGLKRSKSSSRKMREDNESNESNQCKELEQSSKKSKSKICSQAKIEAKNKLKEVKSKQNISKSKLKKDKSKDLNTVEPCQDSANQDLKESSGQCDQDDGVESTERESPNQCCNTVNNGDSSFEEEGKCKETVDDGREIEKSKCSEVNKSEGNKIKCFSSKEQKTTQSIEEGKDDSSQTKKEHTVSSNKPCTDKNKNKRKKSKSRDKLAKKSTVKKSKSSELCQENLNKKTSKKAQRNRSATICSFDKVSKKDNLTPSKSKTSHNSKKVSTKALKPEKKSKVSKTKNDPKTNKSEIFVKKATICSKPSKDLAASSKGKPSSSRDGAKAKSMERSTGSKDKIAKGSRRSKSTRMCSLHTLQKRATENAVQKSKTVEVKSFSEMKSESISPEIRKLILQNGITTTKLKYQSRFQDPGDEGLVILYKNKSILDDCNTSSLKSTTTKVYSNNQQNEFRNNATRNKFALSEGRHTNKYSKLKCAQVTQLQRNLPVPENKSKNEANVRDSVSVKNIHTIKSPLPKTTLKTWKADSVPYSYTNNSNIKTKMTKKIEACVNDYGNNIAQNLDKAKIIKPAESIKKEKQLMSDKTFVKGKSSNEILGQRDIKSKKEPITLSNKTKRGITTGSVEKAIKELKELIEPQQLDKAKILNPKITKRFGLRSNKGSNVLPSTIITPDEGNRNKSSWIPVEENEWNSGSLKKTATDTVKKCTRDLNYSNNTKDIFCEERVLGVSKEKKSQLPTKNKLPPSLNFLKSLNKLSNKNENRDVAEQNIISSKNDTQHRHLIMPLNRSKVAKTKDKMPKLHKETVNINTKQSLTKTVPGNLSDNASKINKPIFDKIKVKNPTLANEIKSSPTTTTTKFDGNASIKEDMSQKRINVTNTFENMIKNVKLEKIHSIKNTLQSLQTQNTGDFVPTTYRNPYKLGHFNTSTNVGMKSKSFTAEHSSMLGNSKRPHTVGSNYSQAQKPKLVKSISFDNIENQSKSKVKKVQGNTPQSSAKLTKKPSNSNGIETVLHTKNDNIECQKTSTLKPGKRLKKILKRNPSIQVKRTKTYLLYPKTENHTDNMSLVGNTNSKTQTVENVKNINSQQEIVLNESRKSAELQTRASIIIKGNTSISEISQKSVASNTSLSMLKDQAIENNKNKPLMRKAANINLAKRSSNEKLNSLGINEYSNQMHFKNRSPDCTNEIKPANVLPSFKWNASLLSPFKKIPEKK